MGVEARLQWGMNPRARQLRKDMTDAEKAFWSRVRDKRFHGLRFRRQHPVGPYVVDFYCAVVNLVVEIDGGQHNDAKDAPRTAFLENRGLRIVRFWNHDVLKDVESVLRQLETDLGLD